MARNREESRSELTAQAMQQGIEVTPGQLETIGQAAGRDTPAARPAGASASLYFRVQLVNKEVQDSGAPNHVVCAADLANARETFRSEMGILTIDEQANKFVIEPATEMDFLRAQARRQGIDLHWGGTRKELDQEGKRQDVPNHDADGNLLWVPAGTVLLAKYKITRQSELIED